MSLLEKLFNLQPLDRGKPLQDSSKHVRQEPPVWHNQKIAGWAQAVDKRLSASKAKPEGHAQRYAK
jgi:hypothetical protein